MQKILIFYMRICFCIFAITASAKIISSFGTAPVLYVRDPLFLIPYKYLMLVIGVIELLMAILILGKLQQWQKFGIVSIVAIMMVVYRFGLWWIGWKGVCSCLGNATALINISPKAWEGILRCTLGFLLLSIPGFFCARSRSKVV